MLKLSLELKIEDEFKYNNNFHIDKLTLQS